MTRYRPIVAATRSWDFGSWSFPVIIDNMMNLELLYFASQMTRDQSFADAATAHASTTMKHHFRPDYSSYHVVDYDPETGAVVHKQTHQGISDDSAWSRGQARYRQAALDMLRSLASPAYSAETGSNGHFLLKHATGRCRLSPRRMKTETWYWPRRSCARYLLSKRDVSFVNSAYETIFEAGKFDVLIGTERGEILWQ